MAGTINGRTSVIQATAPLSVTIDNAERETYVVRGLPQLLLQSSNVAFGLGYLAAVLRLVLAQLVEIFLLLLEHHVESVQLRVLDLLALEMLKRHFCQSPEVHHNSRAGLTSTGSGAVILFL